MPSATTTAHAPRRAPSRGRTAGAPSRHTDETLSKYLGELDGLTMLPGDRETEAATRLLALKRQYWRRLLDVRPLFPAVCKAIAEHLPPALSTRLGRADAEPDAALLNAIAEVMADADPGCELADRLAADVHTLACGGPWERVDVGPKPRRSTMRQHSTQLTSCRAAWSAARREFVAANLRLVVTMAHRYRSSGRLPLADLIQEGNLGLMTAVDRFDPRRGFRFSTYGAWWIRHAISRALSDTGRTVRLPVHVIELQLRVARARREFERTHHRAPDTDELATLAQVTPDKIEKLERVLRDQGVTLPGDDEEARSRTADALTDGTLDSPSLMHRGRLYEELQSALGSLEPSALEILRMRFGFDRDEALTLREVGEVYSLSRERIRQLQEAALRVLRRQLERSGFDATDALDEAPV